MKKYPAISMKKIAVLIAVFSIVAGTSAFAKPVTAGYRARQDFAMHFKNAANVNWKTAGQYNKATFVINNENNSVFYNNNTDEFFGVSTEVFLEDLPQPAIHTILTKYKDYTIGAIIKFTDANAITSYFAQLQKDNTTVVIQADATGHTDLYTGNTAF